MANDVLDPNYEPLATAPFGGVQSVADRMAQADPSALQGTITPGSTTTFANVAGMPQTQDPSQPIDLMQLIGQMGQGQGVDQIEPGLDQLLSGVGIESKAERKKLMDEFLGRAKPELHGPDVFSKLGVGDGSGILGSGLGTSDILAALAGLAVSADQDPYRSLQKFLSIASLPHQFRQAHKESTGKVIDRAIRLGQEQSLEKQRQMHQALVELQGSKFLQQQQALETLAKSYEAQGKPEIATQIRSGLVKNVTELPGYQKTAQLSQRVRDIMAGAEQAGKPMTIDQARKEALSEEVKIAGAKAETVEKAKETAKSTTPGSAAASGMIRYNSQTDSFEYAAELDPNMSSDVARKQGFVSLKGQPGATQFAEAVKAHDTLKKSFNQIIAFGLTAAENPKMAQAGITPGISQFVQGNEYADAARLYEAERKNFAQIFDRYWGGVRGASSPQLAQLVASRLPIIGLLNSDSPNNARVKLQAIKNILTSMTNDLSARVGGKPDKSQTFKTDRMIQKLLGISQQQYEKLLSLELSETTPSISNRSIQSPVTHAPSSSSLSLGHELPPDAALDR